MTSTETFFVLAATALLTLSSTACNKTKTDKRNNPRTTVEMVNSNDKVTKPVVEDRSGSAHPFHFADITKATGIDFVYRNGKEAQAFAILESLGGGVGIIDYDRDGRMDLFYPGGGTLDNQTLASHHHGLFRNLGELRFESTQDLAFAHKGDFYNHGIAAGDIDDDGFQDLLITGYGGLQVLQNQGDGTFLQVEFQGLEDDLWSTSAGWADFNGDQLLDLYVTHYVTWSWENNIRCGTPRERDVCSPRKFKGLPDSIFINNGDGTFTDTSKAAGLSDSGNGLGVLLCDIELDGDVDIYVGNDTTDNFLYINDGSGYFKEAGRASGTSLGGEGVADGSMGVDVCDFNGDLLSDIWVANFESESFALYRGEGSNFFLHVSMITGVTRLGSTYVGFGTAWSDFDFDGDEDAIVTNGHVIYFPKTAPIEQKPLFLSNDKGRISRAEFPADSYFGKGHIGRGLALGDLDNDGDLDISISHLNSNVAVLKNEVTRKGSWVSVELIGTQSNRFAIGASLVLETDQNSKMLRHVKGCTSYLSTFDNRVYWGLPKGSHVTNLTIHWPGGKKQQVNTLELNHQTTILEPR